MTTEWAGESPMRLSELDSLARVSDSCMPLCIAVQVLAFASRLLSSRDVSLRRPRHRCGARATRTLNRCTDAAHRSRRAHPPQLGAQLRRSDEAALGRGRARGPCASRARLTRLTCVLPLRQRTAVASSRSRSSRRTRFTRSAVRPAAKGAARSAGSRGASVADALTCATFSMCFLRPRPPWTSPR